jgi:hypothetical protein
MGAGSQKNFDNGKDVRESWQTVHQCTFDKKSGMERRNAGINTALNMGFTKEIEILKIRLASSLPTPTPCRKGIHKSKSFTIWKTLQTI